MWTRLMFVFAALDIAVVGIQLLAWCIRAYQSLMVRTAPDRFASGAELC